MRGGPALLLALLLSPPASAEVFRIDGPASRAEFSLRVAWVRRIDGRFTRLEGQIERDDQTPGFDVDVRIDAHSLAMANPNHAEWARSPEFFDAESHPWLQFSAVDVREPVLRDGGTLQGELMLRGIRRPQSLTILPADCPRPGFDCAIHAQAELQRSDFGMSSRRLAVSDRVRLRLAIRFAE
jgi:polyisoprenoid-binding protein YceI